MRSAFSMGVMDVFLEKGIEIEDVYGISAGTMAGAPYVSNQARIMLSFRPRMDMSFAPYQQADGRISMVDMGRDMLDRLKPYDYDAYIESKKTLWMGAMRAEDNQMVYFGKDNLLDHADFWTKSMASCSLPDVAVPVTIDGVDYYDGGLIEPIPLQQGIRDGHDKHIIVLTQDRTYVKEPFRGQKDGRDLLALARKKHPLIDQAFVDRHLHYNAVRKQIREMEAEGSAIVLYPSKPVTVGTFDMSLVKLFKLYLDGRRQAKKRLEEIRGFIE